MSSVPLEHWNAAGFTERDMWAWEAVGVTDPRMASAWGDIGFSTQDVDFLSDIDVTDPAIAAVWVDVGLSAGDMCVAYDGGVFSPAERQEWVDAGVDILDVRALKELGWDTPESAGSVLRELKACGSTRGIGLLQTAAAARRKAVPGSLHERVLSLHVVPMATLASVNASSAVAEVLSRLSDSELLTVVKFVEAEFSSVELVDAETLSAICAVVLT